MCQINVSSFVLSNILLFLHPFTPSPPDQASASDASVVGLMAEEFAQKGWGFAQKQSSSSSSPSGQRRSYSTCSRAGIPPPSTRGFSNHANSEGAGDVTALITGAVDNFPSRLRDTRTRLLNFMEEEVYPAERRLMDHQVTQDRWKPHPLVEEMKVGPGVTDLMELFFLKSFWFRVKQKAKDYGTCSSP